MSPLRVILLVPPLRTRLTALLLAFGVTACSDSPVQPGPSQPLVQNSTTLALSGTSLERCQALVDPDWLCESQAIRDELCRAAVSATSVDIQVQGRFLTLRYRVTFQPQSDGRLLISLAWIKADGSLLNLGSVMVPQEKVAKFLAGCPAPDLTNMVFRTTWQDPAGGAVAREHRAIAGEPTPLDVDATAGADVIADVDYATSGIAIALTRAAIEPFAFTLGATRDASAGDDRLIDLSIDALPENLAFALDGDARRLTGSVSSPMARLLATISAGTSNPNALAVDANLTDVAGAFELNFQSGVQLTASSGIGQAEIGVRSANRLAEQLPADQMGVMLRSDATGMQLALRARGVRTLSVGHPLSVDADILASPLMTVRLGVPGSDADLRVENAPQAFSLRVSEQSSSTGPRTAFEWQANAPTKKIALSVRGLATVDGGELGMALFDVATALTASVAVPSVASGPVLRYDFESNSSVSLVELSAAIGGLRTVNLSMAPMAPQASACFAEDGTCRPTDKVPERLADYAAFGDNPAQDAAAGGLNRPYPAQLSIDLRSAAPSVLNLILERGNGSRVAVQNFNVRNLALDVGLHPTSPTFSFAESSRPRFYMYVDSDDHALNGLLTTSGVVQSFSPVAGRANNRLMWLPGTKCTTEEQGSCASTDLDRRVGGSFNCSPGSSFVLRAEGVTYNLLNHSGSPIFPPCS